MKGVQNGSYLIIPRFLAKYFNYISAPFLQYPRLFSQFVAHPKEKRDPLRLLTSICDIFLPRTKCIIPSTINLFVHKVSLTGVKIRSDPWQRRNCFH
jgi:hypothetical protein